MDFDFVGKFVEFLINFIKLEFFFVGIIVVGKFFIVWKVVFKVEFEWRILNIKDCIFLNNRIFKN